MVGGYTETTDSLLQKPMSRIDKRLHQAAVLQSASDGGGGGDVSLANVRMFAFSNHVKGYQPQFAPEAPVIVLKSKSTKVNVHPCAQWSELSAALYRRNQCCHPQFVVDTTGLPSQLELEEDASQILCGPVAKRAVNVVARLNPQGATLVAAGASSILGMKLVLLADRKRNSRGDALFHTLVVVCPASVEPFQAMVAHATKHHKQHATAGTAPSDALQWSLVVLVSDADQASRWKAFLTHPMTKAFFPTFRLITQCGPLFEAIADAIQDRCDDGGEGGEGDTSGVEALADADEGLLAATRLPSPRVFQITFVLSRFTKQVEQEVEYSDLNEWRCGGGESAATRHDSKHHVATGSEVGSSSAAARTALSLRSASTVVESSKQPPLCELMHLHHEHFTLDAYVVDPDKGIVGNSFGTIALVGPPLAPVQSSAAPLGTEKGGVPTALGRKAQSPIQGYTPGDAIRAHVLVRRSLKGRTTLEAAHVDRLSPEAAQASTSLASNPSDVASWLNVSAVSQLYGVLIVRGAQCVLVRSLSGEYRGMRMPHQVHDDNTQSAMECAIEAACVQCDISEDNLGIHPFVAPVTYYPAPGTCVTIYAAVANFAPPSTDDQSISASRSLHSNSSAGTINLNDPYDWLSFSDARQALTTKAERHALTRLAENLQMAAAAGIYCPPHGLGVFGEASHADGKTVAGATVDGGVSVPATASGADDASETRSVVVVHTSAGERGAALEALIAKAFYVAPTASSSCLFIKGALGRDTLVEDAVRWLRGSHRDASASASRYIILDPDVAAEDVGAVGDLCAALEEPGNAHWSVTFVAFLSSGCVRFLSTLATMPASRSRYERVRSIVAGLESADMVLVHPLCDVTLNDAADAGDAQSVALAFVRLVLADAPVPVIADWDNPNEFLRTPEDELVDGDGLQAAATTAVSAHMLPTMVSVSHYFSVWTYCRAQPFHPQRLAAATTAEGPGVFASCGPALQQLCCVRGFAWLSTRFGYRADVRLVVCDQDPSAVRSPERSMQPLLALSKGNPWWCLVDEADRPNDADPSTWDARHGDRQQRITFVFATPREHSHGDDNNNNDDDNDNNAWPVVLHAAVRNMEAALDAMLCAPSEWRVWQRHPDPLPAWDE